MFAAELAYCVPLGIPHSTFLDWDDDDRAKAIAYRRWDSARCGQCGTFPDEWLDERGRVMADPPWEPEVVSCEGCRQIDETRKQIADEGVPGLQVRLVPPRPDEES